LLTILINQRSYLMERGVRIHAQLSQLEAEGVGLNGLAQAMSEISGRGVLVQDKRLQLLSESPSSTLFSIWMDVLSHLSVKKNLPEILHDRKKAGQQNLILSQLIPGGLERLITPIVVGGVARGYLSLVGMEGEFDFLDHLVAEQGALVCGVDMARTKAVREAEKRLKGDLLSAVLSDDLTPRDTHLWVESMGLNLTQSHAVLRFAWDGEAPPSLRRLETLVNGEITRQNVKVILEAVGSEVICVCQSKDAALKLAEAVLEHAKEEYPDIPARCGVGAPVDDLSQWRDSFRQAGQALEMARRLRNRKPLYFPDLSVYRLLLQLEYHPELQAFKQEILGPLLAYEGGGELLRTLEAYFESNANLSQAADALFIHRNTLIYRMERIAEISGLDLDKTETRLAVQLALRIHRMMERD
jgi:purine catabolism regulator